MSLECDYEEALCARIRKELGIESIKMNIRNNRGYPDRIFLLPKAPVWIEFKNVGRRPEKIQRYRIMQLNQLGYDAKWSNDYEASYEWLAEIQAARLSDGGYTKDDQSGLRGLVLRPRTGEDIYQLGEYKTFKRKKTY